jgi:LsmAD domain
LQAWQPSPDGTGPTPGQFGDDLTFGPGNAGNKSWDQFAANEQLYGVKTSFDEDVYTTRLDRSAADFEERERKAQKIANEIIRVRIFLGPRLRSVSEFTIPFPRGGQIIPISRKREI